MDLLFKEIDMLSGLEIVLERIKEYPEEMNKWSDLLGEYIQYFNEEEIQAWRAVQTQMGRERFNEKVLKRLSGEDVEVQKQVTGFQNEVSRIVAAKQQQIQNKINTGLYNPSDATQGAYGNQISAAQQLMYNPHANNNR